MNVSDAERWKSELLDQVFDALAESDQLDESLVFKGARVLNIRMGGGRQSLDIDSNLTSSFVEKHPDREEQRQFLEREIKATIHRHFERQNPVRFKLTSLRVRTHPPKTHPMGWDAFEVKINIDDLSRRVLGLPALTIDVAAPEEILDSSVSWIEVGGHAVRACTLERIAGEKLRAFLSSLPAYRLKVKKPGEAIRAKDLYDIARVRRVRDSTDEAFWKAAGTEFQLACRSRFIDCLGIETFQEQWDATAKAYREPTIPKDIPFEEVETVLAHIVMYFESIKLIPFSFPLPASK